MEINIFFDYLNILYLYLSIIVIPLLTFILSFKAVKQRKTTGKWSYIRLLVIGGLFAFSWITIWKFLFDETSINIIISKELYGIDAPGFSLYNIGLLLLVTFGLTIVFYGNGLESMYYAPFLIFFGMLAFHLVTGFSAWLRIYTYIIGFISLIFLYFTGLRIRDNGSLGLAIIFTLAIAALLLRGIDGSFILRTILNLGYNIFGLVFAAGYFKPFKKVGGV
ncbi:MAG: hypothetical protein EU549_01295 [Promethearchaeota archaeon]|nr:MAG: hypothetical protein EU549_01295 [Candidatus Lokiarchaeota archaeon]